MKKTKRKFRIGDVVVVKKIVYTDYVGNIRELMTRSEKPFTAVVTGYKYLCEGNTVWNGEHHYFNCTNQKEVVMVRKAVAGKEIPVFEEDLKVKAFNYVRGYFILADDELVPDKIMYERGSFIPQNPSGLQSSWMSDEDRKELSEIMKKEMKDWPRDSKGRWIKKEECPLCKTTLLPLHSLPIVIKLDYKDHATKLTDDCLVCPNSKCRGGNI